jgi:hypothetical protein
MRLRARVNVFIVINFFNNGHKLVCK